MPPSTKGALFLGLELATDQLRATIVDDTLELVGVDAVDFDTEIPEYQTHGGVFTTPGDAYTTPVEMWIKALDLLLEKLSRNHDLSRVRSVGGSAQHALVWWNAAPLSPLSAVHARLPLHQQLTAAAFALPNTPVAQDTSAHTHALALETALGGPDHMAARVGTCAHPSLAAAQLLRVREAWPQVWLATGRVQVASAFLQSLVTGAFGAMAEAEAVATGMWVHGQAYGQGRWDDDVLDIVGGSREEGRRVKGWLGEVDASGGGRRAGTVSRFLIERFGFEQDTIVTTFTSDYLSSYLSLCPSPSDAVLAFGPMDLMMAPAVNYRPTRLYSLYPHPAQDSGEKRRYVAALASRNADVPRALVRDMYTKSWSAFDRLVAIVPPGGSIGLDDKLFSFWLLQGDSFPLSHVKGIYRFETGVKVNEFRDLRANPRCLVESQLLSFRVRWSRMFATGVLGPGAGRGGAGKSPNSTAANALSSLGLAFDAYDSSSLPAKILVTGAVGNCPSVAGLIGDLLAAPIYMPTSQIDGAQVSPHRNAPAPGYPGRAALGSAYVARWVWGRGSGAGRAFEEEVRRLLGKRWGAAGGQPQKTNVNGTPSTSAVGATSGAGAAAFPKSALGVGLGSTVLVEEEEEDVAAMEDQMGRTNNYGLGFAEDEIGTAARLRSAQRSPANGAQQDAPATPTPSVTTLTPVAAMPTGEPEIQLGLAKIAEPDMDAFMAYAGLVPEYVRLESMLIKALV